MSFKDDGYFIIKDVLSHEECDLAAADIDKFYASGNGSRVVNLHMDSEAVLNAITKKKVFDWLSENCFEAPAIYTTLSFQKGTQQPIHRDVPHFFTSPLYKFVGVWYALEDTDLDNGCLQYYKGGHKIADLDGEMIFNGNIESSMNYYQSEVQKSCQHLPLERGVLKKGDVIVWDALLPHGGGKILKEGATRKSVVAHCVPMGTRVYNAKKFFNQKDLELYDISYRVLSNGWRVQKQPPASFQSKYV